MTYEQLENDVHSNLDQKTDAPQEATSFQNMFGATLWCSCTSLEVKPCDKAASTGWGLLQLMILEAHGLNESNESNEWSQTVETQYQWWRLMKMVSVMNGEKMRKVWRFTPHLFLLSVQPLSWSGIRLPVISEANNSDRSVSAKPPALVQRMAPQGQLAPHKMRIGSLDHLILWLFLIVAWIGGLSLAGGLKSLRSELSVTWCCYRFPKALASFRPTGPLVDFPASWKSWHVHVLSLHFEWKHVGVAGCFVAVSACFWAASNGILFQLFGSTAFGFNMRRWI